METTLTREAKLRKALLTPILIQKELNRRSFYEFFLYFWSEISEEELVDNWHIKYVCDLCQESIEAVAENKPKLDTIINIPPGSTKTSIIMIALPVWAWTRWYWMKFICLSYAAELSLESAEKCRDLVRSDKFKTMYPDLAIKEDKDTKRHYKIVKLQYNHVGQPPKQIPGGGRFSTSVGGSLTGFHGHVLLVDDPLNPEQAHSETELKKTNRWLAQTLSTRKINKETARTIYVMQRLHRMDPSGYMLDKNKKTLQHICIPGDSVNYGEYIKPAELIQHYQDGLFDPVRLNWDVLEDLEADLGQYGFAGQIGQNPTPPQGGMFKVDHFATLETMVSEAMVVKKVRYWDKAGTAQIDPKKIKSGGPAYTVGVKMYQLKTGKWLVVDVKRGRWSSEEREEIILTTAQADGVDVEVWVEQEPGSGGKESAEATVKNLSGFTIKKETPVGNKTYRADPFSVQVNNGNVLLLRAAWNHDFIEEYRDFPFSAYKDQVDAGSGAFSKLTSKRTARAL